MATTVAEPYGLNGREVALLVVLVANLDPTSYVTDAAKALIHKCRDMKDNATNVVITK